MTAQHRIIFFLLLLLASTTLSAQDPPGAVRFKRQIKNGGYTVCFSPNGQYILGGDCDEIKLWQASTSKELRTFNPDAFEICPELLTLSPDGQYALSYSSTAWHITLWQVSTGKKLNTFKLISRNIHSTSLTSMCFSHDGQYALSGSYDGLIRLWQISTGKRLQVFKVGTNYIGSLCFSPDGQYVLGSSGSSIKLWKINTGKELPMFKGHQGSINSVCFSPDGQLVLSGSNDNTLKLWKFSTRKEILTFKDHNSYVNSVCFSPDGQLVLSGSRDKTIKLWQATTGRLLQSWPLNHLIEDISFTPDSKGVRAATNEYFVTFPVPESAIVKPPNPITFIFSQIIWRSNPTTVHEPAYPAQAAFVSNYPNPIQTSHIRVYVNGQLQAAGQKMGITSLKANQGRYNWEQTLPLMEGGNEIVLGLLLPNQPEVRSEPLAITYLPPTRPNLYVVNIGVSGAGLDYAANDAKQIGELFKKQQGKLFNKVTVFPLYEKGQTNTTRLRKEMSRLSLYGITPNDVLIIFASAHGKKLNLRNGQTDFALQPDDYDNANLSSEETTTLLYRGHVLNNIEDIVCKKLILFDACHSGEAVQTQGSKSQYLRDLRDAQEIVKNAPPGIITLASSSDGQLSWEDSSWQHGAFTKALLDGLNGAADTDKDHFVSVNELFSYLQKTVPNLLSKVDRLKNEKQQPQMYPEKLPNSADFPLVQY